jgi:hypothetical protein
MQVFLFVTEQTAYLKPVFDSCQNYDWCYKKNFISEELQSITHNNGFNLNYFIYCSDKRPDFVSENHLLIRGELKMGKIVILGATGTLGLPMSRFSERTGIRRISCGT